MQNQLLSYVSVIFGISSIISVAFLIMAISQGIAHLCRVESHAIATEPAFSSKTFSRNSEVITRRGIVWADWSDSEATISREQGINYLNAWVVLALIGVSAYGILGTLIRSWIMSSLG